MASLLATALRADGVKAVREAIALAKLAEEAPELLGALLGTDVAEAVAEAEERVLRASTADAMVKRRQDREADPNLRCFTARCAVLKRGVQTPVFSLKADGWSMTSYGNFRDRCTRDLSRNGVVPQEVVLDVKRDVQAALRAIATGALTEATEFASGEYRWIVGP